MVELRSRLDLHDIFVTIIFIMLIPLMLIIITFKPGWKQFMKEVREDDLEQSKNLWNDIRCS